MKETDIQLQPNATAEEPRKQPAPWSTPGRWTITTESGSSTSGYLPAWAEDDPSEAGVPLDLLPIRLTDISHRNFFEGQTMTVLAPDANGKAEEDAVFEGTIDCNPYDPNPTLRIPVVNIQVCLDHWILGLDPHGLTTIAKQLRAQADRLEREVHPALIAAREDWAAHGTD